jgi:hypothetical protein
VPHEDNSPCEQRAEELERRRIALNQQLMNIQTLAEANEIERELWALRAALSYYRSKLRGLGRETGLTEERSSQHTSSPSTLDKSEVSLTTHLPSHGSALSLQPPAAGDCPCRPFSDCYSSLLRYYFNG